MCWKKREIPLRCLLRVLHSSAARSFARGFDDALIKFDSAQWTRVIEPSRISCCVKRGKFALYVCAIPSAMFSSLVLAMINYTKRQQASASLRRNVSVRWMWNFTMRWIAAAWKLRVKIKARKLWKGKMQLKLNSSFCYSLSYFER